MLKSFLLVIAVALIALAAARQGRGAQETTPTPALAPTPAAAPAQPAVPVKNPVKPTAESQAKAKSLYQIDCALCHGDNGSGKTDVATSMNLTLTDWTDPKALAGKADWELFNVIRDGKGQMPAEGEGRAKDVEVWNLVIYIRSLSQPPAPAATAK